MSEQATIETTNTPPANPPAATDPVDSNPTPPAWHESITDEALRGYVVEKGFGSIEDVIKANQSSLSLPSEDATPEQWAEFYSKAGRPEKVEDYGIKAPDGVDPTFSQEASKWMHDLGLNKQQAVGLNEKWNAFVDAQNQAQQQAYERDQQSALEKLQHSYGKDFDSAKELASRAMRFVAPDLDAEHKSDVMAKIQAAIGAEAYFNIFAKLGREFFAEHKFAGNSNNNPMPMTREEADKAIQAKWNDKEWYARYKNGDAAALAEWKALIAKKHGG
ncbi:MAG: hypothetical protein E6Q33_02715 [Neisseriales bacterium]|nr:MAG: hypothetical protein E6Q33_02715 [Neisseriales bacterium]